MSKNNNHSISDIPWFHWPHMLIATGFGTGFWPWGPGTLAGLVALLAWICLYCTLPPVSLAVCNVLLIVTAFIIGVVTDNVMERYWGNDPRAVVIDEFVGTWIATLSALFCCGDNYTPIIYASISFILFRIIDIWKPLGCRWVDKNIHGGLGCMLDDVLAGAYAVIITLAIRYTHILNLL